MTVEERLTAIEAALEATQERLAALEHILPKQRKAARRPFIYGYVSKRDDRPAVLPNGEVDNIRVIYHPDYCQWYDGKRKTLAIIAGKSPGNTLQAKAIADLFGWK